ncbi:hypothetical protein SEA_CRUNCHYBOI_48 [Microbacterium phage CrunchyBoi]|nr:hypothetical protein SEA_PINEAPPLEPLUTO_48 [Microbacterium phage PineapplePluto]QQO39391.1 hypothetical protein SEA_CRUNCHYBOI_48 [Microbacterium phage CrunchyBoi]
MTIQEVSVVTDAAAKGRQSVHLRSISPEAAAALGGGGGGVATYAGLGTVGALRAVYLNVGDPVPVEATTPYTSILRIQ